MFSCKMDLNLSGVKGNGNVTTEERTLTGSFNEIEASSGLDVYLTQGDTPEITVEADDNLHDIIITKLEGNTLIISTEKNIRKAKSKKVYVTFDKIDYINTRSGSDVISTNVIRTANLKLKSSSGSNLEIDVDTKTIDCESSSGSDIVLSGTTEQLHAEASSGSAIKAKKLRAVFVDAKASSGADITVNSSQELVANVSSGGDINYYGNPTTVETNSSVSGGSIRKR